MITDAILLSSMTFRSSHGLLFSTHTPRNRKTCVQSPVHSIVQRMPNSRNVLSGGDGKYFSRLMVILLHNGNFSRTL